jgi:hypothetical protein
MNALRKVTICFIRVLCVAIGLGLIPVGAQAQGDCGKELAEIDRRLESGKYAETNVQIAKGIRDSLAGMCSMMDEATLAQMMEGIEEVLPTRTDEEQRAIKEAKSAVAEASREARKAAEASRSGPGSGIGGVDGSGASVASGFVNRSEDMLRLWIWDWDIYNGNARVLYETLPSRTQLGRPDWRTWVYVVEISPNGKTTQRVITSKQAHENSALALRRGHDEVLLQRRVGAEGTPTTLERWSIPDTTLLSSVPTPVVSIPQRDKMNWMPFRGPTSDGNVLFVSAYSPQPNQSVAAWYEASPNGTALGQGTLPIDGGGFTNLDLVRTRNGGGALPLMFDADEDIVRHYGSATVAATIINETRLLIIGDDGSAHRSPVIGRFMMPTQVDMGSMQFAGELEHEFMADRSIVELAVGPRAIPMIQPVGDGYVILTQVTADRSRAESVHGYWLVWVGHERAEREFYINPLAEDLNVSFTTFTTTDDGEIVLYGNSNKHNGTDYVVLLGKEGSPRATAAAHQPKNGKIEGMLADGSGVWLFGQGYPTDEFSRFRFWFERIEF